MLTSTGAVIRSTTSCRTSGADLYITVHRNISTECKRAQPLVIVCPAGEDGAQVGALQRAELQPGGGGGGRLAEGGAQSPRPHLPPADHRPGPPCTVHVRMVYVKYYSVQELRCTFRYLKPSKIIQNFLKRFGLAFTKIKIKNDRDKRKQKLGFYLKQVILNLWLRKFGLDRRLGRTDKINNNAFLILIN